MDPLLVSNKHKPSFHFTIGNWGLGKGGGGKESLRIEFLVHTGILQASLTLIVFFSVSVKHNLAFPLAASDIKLPMHTPTLIYFFFFLRTEKTQSPAKETACLDALVSSTHLQF